jgi:uncharacterized protein GlcG (DUF336 family)
MSNLADRKALTHDGTIAIATAAVAEAKRNGWNVTIAIVDAGGHPLHLQRLDGAGPGTAAAAVSKARTSALYGFETKGFEGMVKDGRTGILNLPDSLPLEGGLPITVDGVVVGGVGVSGVASSDDAKVAKAGIDALL